MANIGLKKFTYGELKSDGTYGSPAKLAGAIECKVAIETNEAELYADDALAEAESSFKKATLTLGIDDDDDKVFAELLGNTTSNLSGSGTTGVTEVTQKTEDSPKEVGFGHIVTKKVGGVRKYKVEFFPRVKFKPFAADKKTKGDSLEFTTPSIEGTVMPNSAGVWEKHATFDTLSAAESYLTSCFPQTAV